jgi:hypothetical protein
MSSHACLSPVEALAGRRAGMLAAAVILLPVAVLCALAEIFARRGGTIYVEARRV